MSLDGVEFKISDSVKPPAKVTLPLNFDIGNPSEVLFLDYDFTVEEKTIAFCEAQRELEKKKQQAEEERKKQQEKKKQEEEQKKLEEEKQKEEEKALQLEQQRQEAELKESAKSDCEVTEVTDITNESPTDQASVAAVSSACAQPVTSHPGSTVTVNSSGILTPMLINDKRTEADAPSRKPLASFNLADFEKEKDPFEELERDALNDQQQLSEMFGTVQTQQQPVSTAQFTTQHQPTSAAASVASVYTHPVPNHSVSQTVPTNVALAAQATARSLKDVDYPDIDYGTVSSANDYGVTNGYHDNATCTVSTNEQLTASYHHRLPPLPHGGVVASHAPQSTNSQRYVTPISSGVAVSPQTGNVNIYSRHSVAYTAATNSSGSGQLRSARSTPDIACDGLLHQDLPHTSQTPPPPIQPNTADYTAPSRAGSQQSWNPCPVIPPIRTPNSVSPVPPGGSAGGGGGSRSRSRGASPVIPDDPYNRLSNELQRFVNRITDMGFPRARVSRAVEKLGDDDKKVVDFLFLVNKLAEKGYPSEVVEDALHIFNYNEQKVVQFLQLFIQFKQLGFESQNVREALLQSSLDQERTLDMLTAA